MSHYRKSWTTVMLAGGMLLAQEPPAEVLRRTPPPEPGAVVLGDGTKLVPAGDPYQASQEGPLGPAPAPTQGRKAVSGEPAPRDGGKEADVAAVMKRLTGGGPAPAPTPEESLQNAIINPATKRPRRRASELAAEAGLALIPSGTAITLRNLTRVNTQLGGTCVAMVDYDVKDAQLRNIGIQRGSRFIAQVEQVGNEGQNRAAVVFRKLVDPEGDETEILIPAMATDRIGQTGVPGRVDRHWGLRLGGAFAFGILNGLVSSTAQVQQQGSIMGVPVTSNMSFGDTVKTNIGQTFGNMGQSYLQNIINIKPDIEIPENSQMRIILTTPLYVRVVKRVRPW